MDPRVDTSRAETMTALERILGAGAVLPVDKPAGPTSHDVVAHARRALGLRRVGHTGTLDPFATGLLLLCVGPATRLSEYLVGLPKTYLATALLGTATDTMDRQGSVIRERPVPDAMTGAQIDATLEGFRGEIFQVPPQYSAKKVDGEAMHRKARRGERVELDPVEVTIHTLDIVDFASPHLTFRVTCSSGTYVRALASDLGEALGVGAHLEALRREAVGGFPVGDALSLEGLTEPEMVIAAARTPLQALSHLPQIEVGSEDARRIFHGRSLIGRDFGIGVDSEPSPKEVALSLGSDLLAVAEIREGLLRPRKVFITAENLESVIRSAVS